VKLLFDRAVVVTLLPLALALSALGVREATRIPFLASEARGSATEFVPPPLFLAASAAPGRVQGFRVDTEKSSARVATVDDGAARGGQTLRARGSMRILADESIADVELDLEPLADARANGWLRDVALHLRSIGALSRSTAVPGVRASDLRCSVVIGGVSREVNLALTWLRLPGGKVELHAVAGLDWAPFDLPEPWPGRMLRREPRYEFGMHLVLRVES